MKIKVNGDYKEIELSKDNINLKIIIETLGFNEKLIVVEFNGAIINRQKWDSQKVKDGDVLNFRFNT